MGSIAGHQPGQGQSPSIEDSDLLKAARDLGYEAARAKHEILLREVDSKNIVDGYVLEGAKAYCSEASRHTATVEMHLPEGVALEAELSTPGLTSEVHRYPGYPQLLKLGYPGHYFNFLGAMVRAIDSADLIITMGNGQAVRMGGILSASGLTPTLAIASFGGSSREVYEQNRVLYLNTFGNLSTYSVLVDPWRDTSAAEIIDLAERFTDVRSGGTPHSYFVSYSHEDTAEADHIELLLRRSGRRTLRDETELRLGSELHDSIAALIAECRTFLAVGSETYKKKDWCLRELSFARAALGDVRVVYVDTDGSGPPPGLVNHLGIKARSREARVHAVEKVILEEARQ